MTKLIGLSGSLRQGSLNTSLLAAATGLMPPGAELIVGSIRGIPLYDGDVEAASGIPNSVENLKSAIAVADGVLLVTPEYNNSIPGVFKNVIDWLSRPPADIKRFRRQTRRAHGRLAGRVRNDPVPGCLAAGPAYTRRRTLVRRKDDGVSSGQCVRRSRKPG